MNRLSIVEKYAQPEVVEFWRRLSEQGLQRCEHEMLARYAPPPARVIDLGCGAGRVSLALAGRGYEVTGIDLVREMIRTAYDLHLQAGLPLRLIQADVQAVPCASGCYDVALVFIAALQHIGGRSIRQRVFGEIARVLRSGGVLILALDNLAPALTCYAWWAWRKVRSISMRSRRGHSIDLTAADDLLESRRVNRSALSWHVRGLRRTLRWRTWNGFIDAARRMRWLPGEVGDLAIDQVSLDSTHGSVYYHIYQHAELIEDAARGGFELLAYHDGRELNEGQTFPARIRQLDKQVLYAFRR